MPGVAHSANAGNFRLYFHKASSASLRVLLFVRYARDNRLTLVEVKAAPKGAESAFMLPEGDPEALRLGTRDYNAFNPEGRIPVLQLAPGRQLTQSGAILLFLMSTSPAGSPMRALTPADPWQHAVARQVADIVACDIHPLQNKPVAQRLMAEFGMHEHPVATHPFRLHFLRRGFAAVEKLLACASDGAPSFAAGPAMTFADFYLVPQVRNGLGAGIDIAAEYPTLNRVWLRCLAVPAIYDTLTECGGVVQPGGVGRQPPSLDSVIMPARL